MKKQQALTLRLSSIQQRIPENQSCCECSASNPDWAFLIESQNHKIGAFVCQACAIAHQTLQQSLTRHEIKSITAVDGSSCKFIAATVLLFLVESWHEMGVADTHIPISFCFYSCYQGPKMMFEPWHEEEI